MGNEQHEKFAARELSERFGCSIKTIHNHANILFGKESRGFKKARRFNEAQATAILESIKKSTSVHRGKESVSLERSVQTQETGLSLDFQLALAERKAHELWKRKALEQEARAMKAESELQDTRFILDHRTNGLEFYQRIAESTGLVLSDKDDLMALYRGYR